MDYTEEIRAAIINALATELEQNLGSRLTPALATGIANRVFSAMPPIDVEDKLA